MEGELADEGWGGFGPTHPRAEIQVPKDQRPATELENLKAAVVYSWPALEGQALPVRLGLVFGGLLVAVAGPISAGTYPPAQEPLEFALAALVGASFGTAVVGFRLYLGWSYVSSRLLSASVEYEETGWYDGQVWVKPPEILARDRLLESFEVRPALRRLKGALLATGLGLVACASGLAGVTGGGSA